MLSTQYSNVYSSSKEPMEDANEIFPAHGSYPTGNWIHNVPFDEEDIIDAIDEIPTTAAAGPDCFPALLLKNCKYSLSKPLLRLPIYFQSTRERTKQSQPTTGQWHSPPTLSSSLKRFLENTSCRTWRKMSCSIQDSMDSDWAGHL